VLFELPDGNVRHVLVDRDFVSRTLESIVRDEDLRRYIL
jgi:ATP-dependent protease HslVU (ClpYQ) ATPase subunit